MPPSAQFNFLVRPIFDRRDAFVLGAMRAAIHHPARFDSMADNPASAVAAFRSQFVDGALKAIKVMGNAVRQYFQRFVVLIAANFTSLKACMELILFFPRQLRFQNTRALLFFTALDHMIICSTVRKSAIGETPHRTEREYNKLSNRD